jgi:hypothetical protein
LKKIYLAFFALFFTTVSRTQGQVVIDPDAVERTVAGNFDAISISGGIDLYLSQSGNAGIAVSAASENIRDGIKTVIENGTLRIYYEGDKNWRRKDRKLRVYVSFTTLKKLDASGGCDVVQVDSLTGASFDMEMSGACDFKGRVNVERLGINLSGASDINITGRAGTAHIECSGASDVNGYELVADICNANASGASDIRITVNREIAAHATGASDIFYKGNALLKEHHAGGASDISKKDE